MPAVPPPWYKMMYPRAQQSLRVMWSSCAEYASQNTMR